MSATHVALVTDEESQGKQDLNGDGDTDDPVLQLYDLKRRAIVNLRQAVTGPLMMNETLIAFLISEADQGATDLNGDGDTKDKIAAAYLLGPAQPIALRQAATESFAVSERAVAFLTLPAHTPGRHAADNDDEEAPVCQIYRVR